MTLVVQGMWLKGMGMAVAFEDSEGPWFVFSPGTEGHLVLGMSPCDDTAGDRVMLSNVVANQALHATFGGVF